MELANEINNVTFVKLKKPVKTYTCSYDGCLSVFTKKRKFVIHQSRHTEERSYACDVPGCTKTYTNSSHLKRHIKVSHEKHRERVKCAVEECGKEFYDAYGLRRHYSRAHNPDRKYAFMCPLCNKGFHRDQHLNKHNIMHTGELPFLCGICDARFETMSKCKRHQRTHVKYSCECGESFERWVLLQKHGKTCPQTVPNCYTCNKKFSSKTNLKDHQQIHLDEKAKHIFKCPEVNCDNFYFYKKNLVQHIKTKHGKIIFNLNDYLDIKPKEKKKRKKRIYLKTAIIDETTLFTGEINIEKTSADISNINQLIKVEYCQETPNETVVKLFEVDKRIEEIGEDDKTILQGILDTNKKIKEEILEDQTIEDNKRIEASNVEIEDKIIEDDKRLEDNNMEIEDDEIINEDKCFQKTFELTQIVKEEMSEKPTNLIEDNKFFEKKCDYNIISDKDECFHNKIDPSIKSKLIKMEIYECETNIFQGDNKIGEDDSIKNEDYSFQISNVTNVKNFEGIPKLFDDYIYKTEKITDFDESFQISSVQTNVNKITEVQNKIQDKCKQNKNEENDIQFNETFTKEQCF